MSSIDHCNDYIILLCQVIAVITITLIVLNKLNCCYNILLVHRRSIFVTVTTLHVVIDNTLCYNNGVIVTLNYCLPPIHVCTNMQSML